MSPPPQKKKWYKNGKDGIKIHLYSAVPKITTFSIKKHKNFYWVNIKAVCVGGPKWPFTPPPLPPNGVNKKVPKGRVQKKKEEKKCGPGAHFWGGGGVWKNICRSTILL